jgi:acyl-CoA synthetase (AMP-forming)/AMP-acid ligase II
VADGATFDPDAIRAECARALASFKVPVAVVRVDALPRTALGKVQKHLLPAWEGASA